MPRLLSFDPVTQKVVQFHALPDGRFVVETLHNVQDVVDHAADIRAVQKSGWKGENHVGSIPMPIYQRLRAEGRFEDPKDIARWLNAHPKLATKGRL